MYVSGMNRNYQIILVIKQLQFSSCDLRFNTVRYKMSILRWVVKSNSTLPNDATVGASATEVHVSASLQSPADNYQLLGSESLLQPLSLNKKS